MSDRTMICIAFCVAFAFVGARSLNAQSLDVLGVDSAAPAAGSATSSAVSVGTGNPQVQPSLPNLRYRWRQTSGVIAEAKDFRFERDTVPFDNFAGGVCFGMNYLALLWLRQVVAQTLSPSLLSRLFENYRGELRDVRIANDLVLAGPITRANLESWRLRTWALGSGNDPARRACSKLQAWDWWRNFNGEISGDYSFPRRCKEDVEDTRRQISLVDIEVNGGGHSLIVYRVESGAAEPDGGGQKRRALRFMFYDPNDGAGIAATQYLIFFPDSNQYAFGVEHLNRFAAGGAGYQTGTFYTGPLRIRSVHYLPARVAGSLYDRVMGNVD